MSRTIRNRTPSNGLNEYAFHKRKDSLERWRKHDDTDSVAIDNFLTFYRRDGYCMRGNKKFRYAKNRSQKQSFKQIIHHALKMIRLIMLRTFFALRVYETVTGNLYHSI